MAKDSHTGSGRQRLLAALVAAAEPELSRIGAGGVTVTLAAHAQLVQLAYSTGAVARELFELQRTLGEGPTLTAVTRGVPIIAELADHSADHDEPWIAFGHEARARGIDRIYAIPLGAGGVRVGALTVHIGPCADIDVIDHSGPGDPGDPQGGSDHPPLAGC